MSSCQGEKDGRVGILNQMPGARVSKWGGKGGGKDLAAHCVLVRRKVCMPQAAPLLEVFKQKLKTRFFSIRTHNGLQHSGSRMSLLTTHLMLYLVRCTAEG